MLKLYDVVIYYQVRHHPYFQTRTEIMALDSTKSNEELAREIASNYNNLNVVDARFEELKVEGYKITVTKEEEQQ